MVDWPIVQQKRKTSEEEEEEEKDGSGGTMVVLDEGMVASKNDFFQILEEE